MNACRLPTADLPDLVPGVTLVDIDEDLGVTPVQALLLDRVLSGDGPTFWVDGANRANTTRLCELAPADRVLDRLAGRLETRDSPSHRCGWQS